VEPVLFYVFGAVAVIASLLVVAQGNVMYSVLLLIASFGALSGLYVLLDAPFVAVIQIIIYAGAIMVLFLFVVMLLNVSGAEAPVAYGTAGMRRFGAVLAVALAIQLLWALTRARAPYRLDVEPAVDITSVREIGLVLFTEYAFAFEVTAVLTLVAMLGAIVLTRRGPRRGKGEL
jgi:NADH-quinone oxidoreductase subunit J